MIVIADKPGQLGNRLILFAHFIAYSLQTGTSIANPAFDEYAEYFKFTSEDVLCRYPPKKSIIWRGRLARNYLYRLIYLIARVIIKTMINNRVVGGIGLSYDEIGRLDNQDFIDYCSRHFITFMQGWQYRNRIHFPKHAAAIKSFFELKEIHRSNVNALIDRARRNCDLLIGVHIRHGDYKTFLGGRYYYETSQYDDLMKRVEIVLTEASTAKNPAYLVCSNIPQNKEEFHSDNIYFGTGNPVEDMYSLASCDYIIGPPSTFSTWASFYGEKPLYSITDITRTPTLSEFDVADGKW